MSKLTIFAMLSAMAVAVVSLPEADAGKPCATTSFKTQAIKDACASGGQKAAKKVMKKFMKKAKKQDSTLKCKTCHAAMAPDYKLKKDGLDLYKKFGGK